MPEVSLAHWNRFLEGNPDAHFLQTGEWGELKSAFGWEATRLIVDGFGAQVLFRRLALGLTVAYVPKSQTGPRGSDVSSRFWAELDTLCKNRHAILCKIEPDAWISGDSVSPTGGAWEGARGGEQRASPHNIQPRRTVIVDLR
jgi:lipid II:glycine glycyltransferase (peptidoglycan interpeptide bridge formation enzyme)